MEDLKFMFWICVLIFAFQALWEIAVVLALSTFLDGILGQNNSSFNSIFSTFALSFPKDQQPIIGFIVAGSTLLLRNVINLLIQVYETSFSTKFIYKTRVRMFSELSECKMSYFDNQSKGALMQMVINETRSCYNMLKVLLQFITEALMSITYLLLMFSLSTKLSLVVFLLAIIFLSNNLFFGKIIKKHAHSYASEYRYLTIAADEGIGGAKQMKLLGVYDRAISLFAKASWKADSANRKSGLIVESQSTTSNLFAIFSFLLLMVINKQFSILTFSGLLGFFYVVRGLFSSLSSINQKYSQLHLNIPAVNNIIQFLDEAKIAKEHTGSLIKNVLIENEIQFRNVSLDYGSGPVLKNISLRIQKGKKVAFVGESGSGKTSLVNLLPGLYEFSKGEILFDQNELRDLNLKFLRSKIAVVNQDTMLFNCSIRENILMANPNASEEELVKACKSAYAHDFISEFQDGYNTIIGDRGVKISGGQRQRISIAQAFLKKAEVVIFDEATSALDSKSELHVQESIDSLTNSTTCFIVAHRLSTIKNADMIVVMKQGEIIETGSWNELMATPTHFNEMIKLQTFK